jgi:pyridoxal phosphate enzyme (YggS family)
MSVLSEIKPSIGEASCKLVAVSKTRSLEEIMALYDEGQRVFGENRVQELTEKQKLLPEDIEWHLIGHLQSNKLKYIAHFVDTIHSIDSFKLLAEVEKQAQAKNRDINVLLQLKIAEEDTKFGFDVKTILENLSPSLANLERAKIVGVMGMATFTDDKQQVRNEFKTLKSHFEKIKSNFFPNDDNFKEISMGMSGDYKIAIEEGSTMVRIGSLLF